MQVGYLKMAVFFILFTSFVNICLAEGLTVTVTPGYIDEDIKVTEAKIDTFHERMNIEQIDAIVEDASDLMKNALSKDALFITMKNLRNDLGRLVRVKDKKVNLIMGAPIQVRALYSSTFENMEVTESFIFIKENGTDYRLASYQIMKGSRDLAFLEYISWNNKGKDAYYSGNFDKAIQDYSKSIAIYQNFEAYIGRAAAYNARQEFSKAFSDLNKALEIKPDFIAAVSYQRGNVYFAQKDYDNAMLEFEKSLKLNPDLTLVYYSRALVLEEKNEYQQSISEYEEFLRRSYASMKFNLYVVEDAKKRIEQLRQKLI